MTFASGNLQAVRHYLKLKGMTAKYIKDLSVVTKEDTLYIIGREGTRNSDIFYEARRLKSQGYNISFEL